MIIDKNKYLIWENKIIKKYYTNKDIKTELIPKNNSPSVLKQSKVILVLDFNQLSLDVDKNNKKLLPKKHKITLFHIGKMKNDLVSIGYEDNTFSYPGLDFGGLTNYKQKLGTKNSFLPTKFIVTKSTDITNNLGNIYNTWKKYNNKKRLFTQRRGVDMKLKLNKFLRSALIYLNKSNYNCINIRFVKLPISHRVVVTSNDIIKFTGTYYERIFKGDKDYAKKSSGKDLYCAITSKFITTNINKYNLLNEYSTY